MSGGRGWHVTGARRGSRPSPKRGPATPSRLALNEASWSGTARSAGYEWISEPAARVYDRLTPACPNNLERQKRLLDLLIRVELSAARVGLLHRSPACRSRARRVHSPASSAVCA